MLKIKYLILILPLLYAFSCKKGKNVEPKKEEPTTTDTILTTQKVVEEIVILHTNDMHASINNFARLAFIVDSIENLYSNVYLFSAGDMFSGNPIVDMHEQKGMPMVDLMNEVGYDLATLGNHEFDYGQTLLNQRIEQAQFPVICANLVVETGEMKPLEPFYQFTTPKGNKISVVGLLENFGNDHIPATHPLKVLGLKFENPIPTALKYTYLAAQSNVFLLLSHLGNSYDEYFAGQVSGFHAIIGGHSHTTISSMTSVNSTMITQAGSNLKYLGEIKIKLEDGKIVNKTYKLINLSTKGGGINTQLTAKINQYNDNPVFKEVIGTAVQSFEGKEELGSFFCDGLTHKEGIEIAFQNDGGIRIGSIAQGDITMFTIFALDPFGNTLLSLEMTTDEIRSLIKAGFYDGSIGLRVSGIKYTVVYQNSVVKDIKLQHYDGSFLDETKTYKVGISDYIYNSSKFEHHNEPTSLGITTAEAIIQYLKDVKTIDYKGTKRTFVEGK